MEGGGEGGVVKMEFCRVAGVGEGGGWYSVAVKELYETDNSIVIRTELQGPEAGEAKGTEESFPVLIVRTEFRDKPVVFQ